MVSIGKWLTGDVREGKQCNAAGSSFIESVAKDRNPVEILIKMENVEQGNMLNFSNAHSRIIHVGLKWIIQDTYFGI